MIFHRIYNNNLYNVKEVKHLGFEKSEGLRIPDDYLNEQKFMIMRTCHGIGDWGIISAMPRLLKEKYPECKVYVPSKKLLKKLFCSSHDNVNVIFNHNPYVDKFVDEVEGEVFHDHYRIFDNDNINYPLIKQMLKFWQYKDREMVDYLPEIYWTEEEILFGNNIIKEYVGDKDFGALLISERFGTQMGVLDENQYTKDVKTIKKFLMKNSLPYFYFTSKPIEETEFNFINKSLDIRNLDLRIQLYIKSKAKCNIGNQCGMTQTILRYSKCFTSQRQYPVAHNFLDTEIYE
tara:strand:- start:376 stop:1245 length:870 start_codon:yes stop_codon:yes gene_type:complete